MSDLEHRDLRLRGRHIHVAEAGKGDPIVFIHGLFVSHICFRKAIALLSPSYRCIALDLPGSGRSERLSPDAFPYTREAFAEVVADVMAAVGVSRAHVIGHSMGGAIAATFAADRPENVDRLVLINAAALPFAVPFKGKLLLTPVIGPVLMKRFYGRRLFFDYFKNDVWNGSPDIDLDDVATFFDAFDDPASRDAAYAALVRTVADNAALEPKLARIRARTLVLFGDHDRIVPLSVGERTAKIIPNAELARVPGCAHAPLEQRTEIAVERIRKHLEAS